MRQRKPIDAKTLTALAAELADLRVSADAIKSHAAILEPIQQGIDGLRRLPLKNVEPALIFHPVEPRKGGR